jgi:hypothetical protein
MLFTHSMMRGLTMDDAAGTSSRQDLSHRNWRILCTLALATYLLAQVFGAYWKHALSVEDDAFYYLVIAKNIAHSGASTFDGQTLTNGYHPLWMAVLVVQQLLHAPQPLATLLVEVACVSGALYLLLGLRPMNAPLAVGFTWAFLYLTKWMVLGGMEVSLFIFCFAAFVRACSAQCADSAARPSGGLVLGLLAAACIAARLDTGLFILPILLCLPLPRAQLARAVAVVAVLGGAYMATNLIVFGVALPVSSAVKSLGGLQLNRPLLAQAREVWASEGLRSRYVLTFLALLASPALVYASNRRTLAHALAIGAAIGGAAYLSKLVFGSSWRIWPWYDFAVLFPLVAGLLCVAPLAGSWSDRWTARFADSSLEHVPRVASALGLIPVLVLAGLAARKPASHGGTGTISELAIQQFGATLAGQRVAMGDRAGSFAQKYAGPVTQLEGLVGDAEYLRALKRGGDVTPLLCARGVKFLVDYEVPLGTYDDHRVRVLRPRLTQAGGPTVRVHRRDELGHVQNLQLYDNARSGDEGDNSLYIWRLGDCDHAGSPATSGT